MKPIDTGKAYDQIAQLWNSDSFDRDNGVAQHKRALAFARKGGRALDIGCGCSGRFIELLQNKGYAVEGVDISTQMITLARRRHPDVLFHHNDICTWQAPHSYDFITAWDSIWHVPLAQQEQLLSKLVTCLNPGGVLIFSCGGTDEKDELENCHMGPEVYYASLGINAYLHLFAKLNCQCKHFEYDQYPELHCYFVMQKSGV